MKQLLLNELVHLNQSLLVIIIQLLVINQGEGESERKSITLTPAPLHSPSEYKKFELNFVGYW